MKGKKLSEVIEWFEGVQESGLLPTISTPNILATSHLLPETRDQYFISSRWAPSTLSTTSSVLASILWTISL